MRERQTGRQRALADAIVAERQRRDQSQEEAAAVLGTTQQTWGKWENGVTRPSDEMIAGLAKYLGMTQDKVRELRGPMRPDPLDRQLLKRRVERLEETTEALVETLKRIEARLDG